MRCEYATPAQFRLDTYEFTATTTGSHMYHSHHNATDQVGRGLLGAFIVQPKDTSQRYAQRYGALTAVVVSSR